MFCTSVLPKWLLNNKLACVKSPLMGDGSNNVLFQSSVLCLPPAVLSQLQAFQNGRTACLSSFCRDLCKKIKVNKTEWPTAQCHFTVFIHKWGPEGWGHDPRAAEHQDPETSRCQRSNTVWTPKLNAMHHSAKPHPQRGTNMFSF